MKKAVFVLALVALGMHQAANAIDGTISFNGSVDSTTCPVTVTDVNSENKNGVVTLGTVPASMLSKAGEVAGHTAFTLTIDNKAAGCSMTGRSAKVSFITMAGVAGPNVQWLGLVQEQGAAKNVAVQIRDANGSEIMLGERSAVYTDLNQPLRFYANYIATGKATAGPANAKAGFTIYYQ